MSRVLPILFNTDMVRAILREQFPKTTTRRCIKGYIPDDAIWGYSALTPRGYISCRGTYSDGEALLYGEKFVKLPCQKGDILYVRETWQCWRAHRYEATADIRFRAGGDVQIQFANGNTDSINREDYDEFVRKWYSYHGEWRPSIHMPKEAARIWLKVTDVRVKRLQDIGDFVFEGISRGTHETAHMNFYDEMCDFKVLWNSTIKKSKLDLYGWEANPWVWVIEFERCEKPEGEK